MSPLADSNAEVRFRILFKLYQKHYGEELGHPQLVDKFVQEPDFQTIDRNLVNSELVYLVDKQLITGQYTLGRAYPYAIIITSKGIDFVDRIKRKFINSLYQVSNDDYRQITSISGFNDQLRELPRIIDKNRDSLRKVIEDDHY